MSMHMNHSGMMTDMNMTMSESTTMNMHHGHHGHMKTPEMSMHNGHGMNNMGGMDHNMNMNMNGSDSCGMGMMMMYFHTGYCEYILFEAIRTTKVAEMIGACIVIFVLAALYEGLKVLREELLRKSLLQSKYTTKSLTIPANSKENIIVEQGNKTNGHGDTKFKLESSFSESAQRTSTTCVSMISCSHFTQTVLHIFQVIISYALMLVFMTYNAWLCIAIILGAGAGYFLFGWRRAVIIDINEHCH